MTIETENDLRQLKLVGNIVAVILQEMIRRTEPGMTTGELDLIGKELMDYHGAQSAPRVTYNFPGYTCVSINEEAAASLP